MTTLTKTIGPTFSLELTAANLGGLPVVWDAAEVRYDETVLTAPQIAALEAVVTAHDSTKVSPQEVYDAAVVAGFDTTQGWRMALDSQSQQNFSGALSAANAQINIFQVTSNTASLTAFLAKSYGVPDLGGSLHSMTTAEAIQLLLNYYAYVQQITLANT